MFKHFLPFVVGLLLLSGCRTLNPSVMFKTPKGYSYASEDSAFTGRKEFVFTIHDRFEMKVYANDGFNLVDISQNANVSTTSMFQYVIEKDSVVKLPLLGKVNLAGMTLDSAQKKLEALYSQYFINPFVLLKITSRVVYVFFGDGGQGKIVTLEEDHTSLIEALAAAGGISEWGKAYKIKIIRGDLKNPQIFLVDLSTVEGMKKSSLYVQSNDIVYIEPVSNVAAKLMTQLTPFIALLTTVLLTINLLQK